MSNEIAISYTKIKDIPGKAPDDSLLDPFDFGHLKQELKRRRPITIDGLWKVSEVIWDTIDKNLIDKTLASWEYPMCMINRRGGKHIENIKVIHSRSVKK